MNATLLAELLGVDTKLSPSPASREQAWARLEALITGASAPETASVDGTHDSGAPRWEEDGFGRSRGPIRSRQHPARRGLIIASAAMFALVLVAAALSATGHDPFGSLSSWLDGKPGKPASSIEQTGFRERNGASYAAFPGSTKVRQLTGETVGGSSFTLVGFKNDDSLCLRLTRAKFPAARGVNQCVTLRELDSSQSPALVASDATFLIGHRATVVDGIIGFADDTVASIQYRRGNGVWQTTRVTNNVFLALNADPLHSFAQRYTRSSIVQVRAVTKSGKHVAVPYIASDNVNFPNGPLRIPSYISHTSPKPQDLPGPTKTTATFSGGTISWLVKHQPKGNAWSPTRFEKLEQKHPGLAIGPLGPVVYSRAVQPDPNEPLRIGLYLIKANANRIKNDPSNKIRHLKPGALILCHTEISPLTGTDGFSCDPFVRSGSLFSAGQPLEQGPTSPGQILQLGGVAADDVASIRLYLASGRIIPAALTDNAYSVSAPADQLPGKLVSFDSHGSVLSITVYAGAAQPTACPALTVWPTKRLPTTHPYQRLDLGTLTVNGATVLGRTPAQIEQALSKPTRAAGFKHPGYGQVALFYGGSLPSGTQLLIQFRGGRTHPRAASLTFLGRGLTDPKLAHLLNIPPQTLQHLITTTYPQYHVTTPYGSVPSAIGVPNAGGCTSNIQTSNGNTQLAFGIIPQEHDRPFLTITRS